MMQVDLIAVVIAIVAGAIANVLAAILPRFSLQADEGGDEDATQSLDEELKTDGSHTVWNTKRYIVITMVLIGLSFFVSKFPPVIAAAIGFHLVVLMLISVIDIEHRLILSIVLLPSFLIAFLEIVITRRITIADALVGYAVAQIVVMLYYLMGILYLRIVNARRKDPVSEIAFGFGDVSLATFCGLIVGYPRVIYMLILMALVGGIMAFGYLIIRLVIVKRYEAHMAFAYGPAITIAAAIMLLWGDRVAYYLLGGR